MREDYEYIVGCPDKHIKNCTPEIEIHCMETECDCRSCWKKYKDVIDLYSLEWVDVYD